MKTLFISVAILLLMATNITAQADTVFIKYTKERYEDTVIYQTDTVLFSSNLERNFLVGTDKLSWTHNQMSAKNYGLDFKSISKSDCKTTNEREVYNAADVINSVVQTDTSLIVDINIYDNCCYDFLCDIAVDKDGVLNLIYTGYGNYCSCNCCFGLVYELSKSKYTYEQEVKAIILNGNLETLKNCSVRTISSLNCIQIAS